jgi:hypothetical protein
LARAVVVAARCVVEDIAGVLTGAHAVELRVDVAETDRCSAAKLLFEEREDTGKRRRCHGGAANDVEIAGRVTEAVGAGSLRAEKITVVIGGSVQGDVGDVA